MAVRWDRSDPRVWYGTWRGQPAFDQLWLVTEELPDISGWDWAVWQPTEPTILRRGVARSAPEAARAAEDAADHWQWRWSGYDPNWRRDEA